jgi:hypothetical protein
VLLGLISEEAVCVIKARRRPLPAHRREIFLESISLLNARFSSDSLAGESSNNEFADVLLIGPVAFHAVAAPYFFPRPCCGAPYFSCGCCGEQSTGLFADENLTDADCSPADN